VTARLRRWRRRWLVWRRGTWRERWIRCRRCQRLYHRDIWPPPVPRPKLGGSIHGEAWRLRLPCGHTVCQAATGFA